MSSVTNTSTSTAKTSPSVSPTSVSASPTSVYNVGVNTSPSLLVNPNPSARLNPAQQQAAQTRATDNGLSQTLSANSSRPFLKIAMPDGSIAYAENGKLVSQEQFQGDLALQTERAQAQQNLLGKEFQAESSLPEAQAPSKPIGTEATTGRQIAVSRQVTTSFSQLPLAGESEYLQSLSNTLATQKSAFTENPNADTAAAYNRSVTEYDADVAIYNSNVNSANASSQTQQDAIRSIAGQVISASGLSAYLAAHGIPEPTLTVNGVETTLSQFAKSNPNVQFTTKLANEDAFNPIYGGVGLVITSVTGKTVTGSTSSSLLGDIVGDLNTIGSDVSSAVSPITSNPVSKAAYKVSGVVENDIYSGGSAALNGLVSTLGYVGYIGSRPIALAEGKGTQSYSQSAGQTAGTIGLEAAGAVGAGFLIGPLEGALLPGEFATAGGASGFASLGETATTVAGRIGIQAGVGAAYGGITSYLTGGNVLEGAALGGLLFPASAAGTRLALLGISKGGELADSLLYPSSDAGDVPSSAKLSLPTSAIRGAVSSVAAPLTNTRLSLSETIDRVIFGRDIPSGYLATEEGTDLSGIGGEDTGSIFQGERASGKALTPGSGPTVNRAVLQATQTAPERSVEVLGSAPDESVLPIGATKAEEDIALANNIPRFTTPFSQTDLLVPAQDELSPAFGRSGETRVPLAAFFEGIERGPQEAGTIADILPQGPVQPEQGIFTPASVSVRGVPIAQGVEPYEEVLATQEGMLGAPETEPILSDILSQNDVGFLASRTTGNFSEYSFEDIPDLLSGRQIDSLVDAAAGPRGSSSVVGLYEGLSSGVNPAEFTASGSADLYGENASQNAIDRILSEDVEPTTGARTGDYNQTRTIGRDLIDYRVNDYQALTYQNPASSTGQGEDFFDLLEERAPVSEPATSGQAIAEAAARDLPTGRAATRSYLQPYPRNLRLLEETTFLQTPPGYSLGTGNLGVLSESYDYLSALGIGQGAIASTRTSTAQRQRQFTVTAQAQGSALSTEQQSLLGTQNLLDTLLGTQQVQSEIQQQDQLQILSLGQQQSQVQDQLQVQREDEVDLLSFANPYEFGELPQDNPIFPPVVDEDVTRQKKRKGKKQRFVPTQVRNRIAREIGGSFGDVSIAEMEDEAGFYSIIGFSGEGL